MERTLKCLANKWMRIKIPSFCNLALQTTKLIFTHFGTHNISASPLLESNVLIKKCEVVNIVGVSGVYFEMKRFKIK